jgi:glycosyltransferase involved in cell wall biosynthesis
VVIPTYNGERFLAQALDSVFAQEYRLLDVVVVDDGSSDASRQIAGSYESVRCFAQEHQSAGAARNRGVAEARGDLIGFLDQDDLWVPEKLTVQSRYLGQHPEVGIVLSRLRNFVEAGETRPDAAPETIFPANRRRPCSAQLSSVVRSSTSSGRSRSGVAWRATSSGSLGRSAPAFSSQSLTTSCCSAAFTVPTLRTIPLVSNARSCAQ